MTLRKHRDTKKKRSFADQYCWFLSVGISPQTVMLWQLFMSIRGMQNLQRMLLLMFSKQVFFVCLFECMVSLNSLRQLYMNWIVS